MILNTKPLHIFDLDGTLWDIDTKVWVIDKEQPHKPIIRLDNFELNKILNGLYLKDNLKISYNGEEYYISNILYDKIKRKRNVDIERLGLSWIEFIDEKYINNTKVKFLFKNLRHLKGQDIKIVLLTGRSNRKTHGKILNELRKKLLDIGIEIYKIYFVSDKFYYKHNEDISLEKVNILIEHLVGMKIDDGSFAPFKQDWFNNVYFYDDEKMNIDYANDVQEILNRILKNTDDELFKIIIERINNNEIYLTNNLVTNNEMNLFDTTRVKIKDLLKYPIKIKSFNKFLNGPTKQII